MGYIFLLVLALHASLILWLLDSKKISMEVLVPSPMKVGLFAVVCNLFDKKYISGRSPDGIFPGAERNVEIGLAYQFY